MLHILASAPSRAAKTLQTMCVTTFGWLLTPKGQHRAETVGEPKGRARPVGMPGLDRRLRAERRRGERGFNDSLKRVDHDSLSRRAPASAGLARRSRGAGAVAPDGIGFHAATLPQP
jgi:hypothetical protein